jgi:hypothetical protein
VAEAKSFLPMQVGQILDHTTVVVTGPGVAGLAPGQDLEILAVGREIPNLGVPLVVSKATVEVESVAGLYLVARTKTSETEVSNSPSLPLIGTESSTRAVTRREQLTVEDQNLVGNPARTPVRVGDPVIRPEDLPQFIKHLVSQGVPPEHRQGSNP